LPDSQNVLAQSINLHILGVFHYERHVVIVKLTRSIRDKIMRPVASGFGWNGHSQSVVEEDPPTVDLANS